MSEVRALQGQPGGMMYYLIKVKPQARKQIISAINKRITHQSDTNTALNLNEVLAAKNPEYLYLQCDAYEVACNLIANLSNVYGILSKDPLSDETVENYSTALPKITTLFNPGDVLTVQGGPFQSLLFQVKEVHADEILGELNIFGSTRVVTIPKILLQD